MIKLTAKQKKLADKLNTVNKKFVINLIDGTMSQLEAYVAAGGKGSNENSLSAAGSRILTYPDVKAFYDSLIESAASGAVLTKQKTLEILSHSATSNIADFCEFKKDDKGNITMTIKDPSDLPKDLARCIKSISPVGNGFKIELYDSHNAMKQLADMIGWNVPRKTQISGIDDAPIETKMTVTFIDARSNFAEVLTERTILEVDKDE